jgi:Domain of unknown function (DUF6745)
VNPDITLALAADAWLEVGLATGRADRGSAEAAVRVAYTAAGLTPPDRIEWRDSPLGGAVAASDLVAGGVAGASVRGTVRTRPWASARDALTGRLGAAGWSWHWAASGARNWQLLSERIVTPMRTRLGADLAGGDDRSDEELAPARLILLDAVHGQHDAAWLAAFADPSALAASPLAIGAEELAGIAGVARTAGWWWPYEHAVVLTERPTAVHRDNLGRLHHGDGAALSYPDGWSLYAWRGMPIPAAVAAQLPHLTVEQIREESNAEVRRVMLEHFGFERYLRASGARELGRDECGVLWRVELPEDEPLVMVEVVNSTPEPDGSRRTYFLRVPPDTRTARAGVAWTFNMPEDEYRPVSET